MVEPLTILTATAIATMIATKAFEKTGEKIGEAVGGLIPKFLGALRRKDPKTADAIATVAQQPELAEQQPKDYSTEALIAKVEEAAKNDLSLKQVIEELATTAKVEHPIINNFTKFQEKGIISSGEDQRTIEYQQALEIAREIGDRRGEVNLLSNLGRAYNDMFGAQKAVEYLQQSLKITREMGDRRAEGMLLLDLTTTYRWLKEYQRVIDCRQQILGIIREMGDDRRAEGVALGELGDEYRFLGQHQQANQHYQQAIEYYQQAIENYEKSSKVAHEIGDRHNEEVSLFKMGSALIDMGKALSQNSRRAEALQKFQQALAIFEKLKLKDMIEKCKTAIQNQRRKWWQRW